MTIVTDERVAPFMARALGKNIVPPYEAVGIDKDGEIIGGVIFNNFTGNDIHVSVAGKGWSRQFISSIGEYVYDKLHCGRMTVITEQPRIVRIAERLGGQVEGLMRDHFGEDRHGYIVGILQKDWKY